MANTEYKIEFASSSNLRLINPSYATYEEYYLQMENKQREMVRITLIVIITVGLMK